MKQLPAWVGWPGGGVPPSHEWFPGPTLRFVILLLGYGFLAFALSVNYVASVAFFLLAILGMYVGLRRGFLNGLTKAEKAVLVAFAAYPLIAICSYLVGMQTNIGFRFLGRDLRLLLYIPVYVAIRWSLPVRRRAGYALALGVVFACGLAIIQNRPWPAPLPHGFAGTHITFGDLALLSGFLAAVILLKSINMHHKRWHAFSLLAVSLLAVVAAISVSVVSKARGGWLAIPLLVLVLMGTTGWFQRLNKRWRILVIIFCVGASVGAGWSLPSVRHRVFRVVRNLQAYNATANVAAITAPCVDNRRFLAALLSSSKINGPGDVNIVRLEGKDAKAIAAHGCTGAYALSLSNPAGEGRVFNVSLFRGYGESRKKKQTVSVLVKGAGQLTVWWKGPWVQMNTRQWKVYGATQSYTIIGSTSLRLKPGRKLLVVPLQKPVGIYAYALSESSVGQRLQMWKAAWHMFLHRPWLGVGTGAFQGMLPFAVANPLLLPVTGNHEHAHSDYFNDLATKGVIGLVTLLAILLMPVAAMSGIRKKKRIRVCCDMAGIVLVLGFAVFCASESMFVHSLVNSWYAVVTAILVATSMQLADDGMESA